MKKLLFLAIGAIFLVISGLLALVGEKNEVYWGLPFCLGILFVCIAILAASAQPQVVLPQAKKYRARNLFDDEVDPLEEANSYNGQSSVVWASFFLLVCAVIVWMLCMFYFFKMTAFLTIVALVGLTVRTCSRKSTLAEANVQLDQSLRESNHKLSV